MFVILFLCPFTAHLKVFFGVLWLLSLFCFISKPYSYNDLRIEFMKTWNNLELILVIVILFPELQSMEYPVYHSMFLLSALSHRVRSLSIRSGSTNVSAASRGRYRQSTMTLAHDIMSRAALVACICFSDATLIFSRGRARIYFYMVCTYT
jgi:hypothetical protein